MTRHLTAREKEALREAGTPAEIRDRTALYGKTVTQLSSQMHELIKKYPKEWVAMKDDTVVCHSKSLTKLTADCRKKGVSLRDVAIRFLDTEERIMVL